MSNIIGVDGQMTLSLEEAAMGQVANNLTTEVEGFALDARQGKVLNDKKLDADKLANDVKTVEEGFALDARQGKWLNENKVGFADVENSLESDNKNRVLSALQGKLLNDRLNGLFKTAMVTLAASSWSSNKQTVSVPGATADNIVIASPVYASQYAYNLAGVGASAQGANVLTFTAKKTPTATLSVNVLIIG